MLDLSREVIQSTTYVLIKSRLPGAVSFQGVHYHGIYGTESAITGCSGLKEQRLSCLYTELRETGSKNGTPSMEPSISH